MMYVYSFLVEGMDATFLHCLFNALVIYILLPQNQNIVKIVKRTNERNISVSLIISEVCCMDSV